MKIYSNNMIPDYISYTSLINILYLKKEYLKIIFLYNSFLSFGYITTDFEESDINKLRLTITFEDILSLICKDEKIISLYYKNTDDYLLSIKNYME